MSLKTGDVIDGKYEIKDLLGEGGMGAVYRGENTFIHRTVAIKVLHAGVAGSEEAVKRFEREAQAAGRIGSDHIVEVLDLGTLSSGDRYMVMEFLQGEALSDRIQSRGRLSAAELYPIAIQMLEGLSAAHQAGIIHRDLKPDNVFLMDQSKGHADYVKLLDFGISKFNALGTEFSMTRTGSVMGTPYYMAPEQAKGAKNTDARLDVYAAGVILYEAVTGQVPFDGETFNELLFKIVMEETPATLDVVPDLDPGLAAIIDKARQKNPDDRFQTAAEFAAALIAWGETAAPALAAESPASSANHAGALARMATLGAQTGQAWANTAHGVQAPPAPPPARTKLLIAAGGGLLALVVAGSLLIGGGGSDDAASTAASPVLDEAEAQRQKEAELATQKAEALAQEIEATRSEMEKLKQTAEENAKREAERKAEEQRQREQAEAEAKAEEERKAQEQAKAAALARKRRAAARARAARTNTKPKSSTSASSGRKIRTSL